MQGRKTYRKSLTFGGAIQHVKSRVTALTHDIIDPYTTIHLSSSGVTRTTKPVRDGGATCQWTEQHDNVLVFDYPFAPRSWSKDAEMAFIQERSDHLPGTLSIQVFDQDLLMDAHIGGAEISLQDVFTRLNNIPDEFAIKRRDGGPQIKEYRVEIALHRRQDSSVSGFLTLLIRFEKHTSLNVNGFDLNVGKLTVVVESGSDLWDPNDQSDWIPDDAHTGTPICSSLVICALYFGCGTAFYCNVEGWSFIDAIYFAVVTFTTVGYGDVKPLLDGSKIFTCIYMIIGISMVAISIIRVCLAVYEWAALFRSHVHGFYQKATSRCFQQSNTPTRTKVTPNNVTEQQEAENSASSHYKQIVFRMLITVVTLVFAGTVFFASVEEMTLVDACYMSTATVATVGYGDIAPVTRGGRTFAICWIILSYGMIARSLHLVVDTFHVRSLEAQRLKVLNRDLSRSSILNMDKNGDGELSRLEFLSHMVVRLKMCTSAQLAKIMERFDEIEESRIARDRVMSVINNTNSFSSKGIYDTSEENNEDRDAAEFKTGMENEQAVDQNNTPDTTSDNQSPWLKSLTERSAQQGILDKEPHHLESLLHHLRCAAQFSKLNVQSEAQAGRLVEAKEAIRNYRLILELLHREEKLHAPKLHPENHIWSPKSPKFLAHTPRES